MIKPTTNCGTFLQVKQTPLTQSAVLMTYQHDKKEKGMSLRRKNPCQLVMGKEGKDMEH